MKRMLLVGLAALSLSSQAFAQDKLLGIVHAASSPSHAEDVRLYLLCTQPFVDVQLFDATAGTPTIDELAGLDGILIFSGTLFLMAVGGPRWLGAVTPIGGTLFLIAWGTLVYGILKSRP